MRCKSLYLYSSGPVPTEGPVRSRNAGKRPKKFFP